MLGDERAPARRPVSSNAPRPSTRSKTGLSGFASAAAFRGGETTNASTSRVPERHAHDVADARAPSRPDRRSAAGRTRRAHAARARRRARQRTLRRGRSRPPCQHRAHLRVANLDAVFDVADRARQHEPQSSVAASSYPSRIARRGSRRRERDVLQRQTEQRQQREHAQVLGRPKRPVRSASKPAGAQTDRDARRRATCDSPTSRSIACANVWPKLSVARARLRAGRRATIIVLTLHRVARRRFPTATAKRMRRERSRATRRTSPPSMIAALTTSARPSRK